MRLRQHQQEFSDIIDGIIGGSGVKTLVLNVTPGGGKSLQPIISGKLIKAGLADKIAWIVPRKSLQDQAERNFQDPYFRELLGHKLTIRTSTNDVDPCRGLDGFSTTFQAVGVSNGNLFRDFSQKRYILILDEAHHAEKGGTWEKALKPLVEKAAFVIMMTGTMARGNGEEIAFLKYRHGRPVFDAGAKYIKYGRTMALKEKAIIPLRFRLSDAKAAWQENGVTKEVDSIAGVFKPKDISAAIYTALRTNFAKSLLNSALTHWHRYRAKTGHLSAFLAVTADVEHAKQVLKYLKGRGLNAELATSHESTLAHNAIKDYKAGKFDTLVSVAMAYEGLDCPRITHIACLTQIRSEPWIEQCLARAVRVDRTIPYEQQEAFIFAPDDPLFRKIVNAIKAEQNSVKIKNDLKLERLEPGEGGAREPDVIPLGSSLTGDRAIFLGAPIATQEPALMPKTPTEIEAELRQAIEEHIRRFCFKNRYKPQKINSEIKKHLGGKARSEMTLDELGKTRSFVRQNYPLSPASTPHTQRPGISKPRGKGRRAPKMVAIVDPPRQGCLWETRAL